MLGGMFAGHDESGGEIVESEDGRLFKSFHGMSSSTAMEQHYGEIADHRAPEGKAVRVPYRGSLNHSTIDTRRRSIELFLCGRQENQRFAKMHHIHQSDSNDERDIQRIEIDG